MNLWKKLVCLLCVLAVMLSGVAVFAAETYENDDCSSICPMPSTTISTIQLI